MNYGSKVKNQVKLEFSWLFRLFCESLNNKIKNGHGGGRTLDRCVISTTL